MISLQRISKYVNRDESLDQLGNEQKRPLIQRLFKVDTSTLSIADEYDPYFENYSTQIKLFNFGPNSSALSVLERNRRLQPYLVSVVEKLLKEPKSSRQSVKEHLKQVAEEQTLQDRDEAFLDRSIDLALQVWLMLNSRDRANDTSPVTKWNETESLEDLVKDIFPVGDESTDLRFNYRFTAVNIERNSGVKIVWTRYLSEHLSFDDEQDYRKLKIFPDKNWLNDMLDLAKLKTPPESNDIPKHDESMADSGVPHRLGEAEVAKGEAATADGEAAKAKGEIRTTNDVHTSVHSSTANGSSKHTDKHSSVAAPESV
ncbi:hypothetical protein MMC11_000927 [Xylographa trunciseda]|nr:hypothetical protein [Xylographa trunciseda]